jgi:hypothetical protein
VARVFPTGPDGLCVSRQKFIARTDKPEACQLRHLKTLENRGGLAVRVTAGPQRKSFESRKFLMTTNEKIRLYQDAQAAMTALGRIVDGGHKHVDKHLYDACMDAMAGLSINLAWLKEQVGTDALDKYRLENEAL